MFYIGFVAGPRTDSAGRRTASGEITIGDDSPPFEASLDHWSMADYEADWRKAVARLAAGESETALVTSRGGPDAAGHEQWDMQREGAVVTLRPPATIDAARREWQLPLGQLLAFIVHHG